MPGARWTICTSATRAYACAALEIVGIDKPETAVFAEDVEQGKPAYACPGYPKTSSLTASWPDRTRISLVQSGSG
jgi:phosphoglycolate phosphatase-like HAD superfamily hydrolase